MADQSTSREVLFDPARLLHSSYDPAAKSPAVSIRITNTAKDFMALVRRSQVSDSQLNQFIHFIDHDSVMSASRGMVPEFRVHLTKVVHILTKVSHRLPADPGEKPPLTDEQKAFREKYKEDFEEIRVANEESARDFREWQRQEEEAARAPVTDPGTCAASICDKPARLRCGRCKFVYYCDKSCQKKDWRGHKHDCYPPGTPRMPPGMAIQVGPVTTLRELMETYQQARLARESPSQQENNV